MSGVEHKVETRKDSATSSHLIAIALSAAGLKPLQEVLGGLPADLPAAIMVLQHIGESSNLPEILQGRTAMRVKFAESDEPLRSGTGLRLSAASLRGDSADPDDCLIQRAINPARSSVRGLVAGIGSGELSDLRGRRHPERSIVRWGTRSGLDAKGRRTYDRANALDLRVLEYAACGDQDWLCG